MTDPRELLDVYAYEREEYAPNVFEALRAVLDLCDNTESTTLREERAVTTRAIEDAIVKELGPGGAVRAKKERP